jgi:hypothetical protein
MWMTELTMKTSAAERRIGNQRDSTDTMTSNLLQVGWRKAFPKSQKKESGMQLPEEMRRKARRDF